MTKLFKFFQWDQNREAEILRVWTRLAVSCIVFLPLSGLLFYFLENLESQYKPESYRVFISVLIVITHLIIALNTNNYLEDLRNTIRFCLKKISPELLSSLDGVKNGYRLTQLLSVFVIIGVLLLTQKEFGDGVQWWGKFYILNELVSLSIFCSFIFLDRKLIKITEKAATLSGATTTLPEYFNEWHEPLRKQILFLSIPGVIGLLLVTLTSKVYLLAQAWSGDFTLLWGNFATLVSSNSVTNTESFSAGATAIHIVISQVIFAILFSERLPDNTLVIQELGLDPDSPTPAP